MRRREIRKYIEARGCQRSQPKRGDQTRERRDDARIAQGSANDGAKHSSYALVVVVHRMGAHSLQRPKYTRAVHYDVIVVVHPVDQPRVAEGNKQGHF